MTRRRTPPQPREEQQTRTVGQLVADALRLYGSRFWRSLALGVGPAVVGVAVAAVPGDGQLAFTLTVGAVVATASYAFASALVAGVRVEPRSFSEALAVGVLVAIPVPFLASLLVLPAIAWLALVGLAVPVAVIERRGITGSLSRAFALARASYIHALGSLATLAIVFFVTSWALFFLLREQGDATLVAAAFLSVLVISPLLFLGAALLYFDQVGRLVGSAHTRRGGRRDADLHHADEPDGAGAANAEVEPREAARGQP